ncbi:hypothetical protein [Nostoc sp.]|uniref:hypothetical protein n=1 Tax=Nostoc sp. TaxID=1180 RepID=UPI003593FF5D
MWDWYLAHPTPLGTPELEERVSDRYTTILCNLPYGNWRNQQTVLEIPDHFMISVVQLA